MDYTNIKEKMDLAATAAIKVVLKLEPQLENSLDNKPLFLGIQEDSKGIKGDVRDVICIRKENEWEIGFSCKHNHSAVKHSRLSATIDFGKMWFDIPCSEQYFKDINPMFDELKILKDKKVLWRDIESKEDKYYVPLLQAFMNELRNLDKGNPGIIPEKLLTYLLGVNDFYKVITKDKEELTQIQAYNIYGTLNKPAGKVKPQVKIPLLTMPKEFYSIDFKPNSKNTIIVACDEGWTISMRIHSARSIIEPSLKFDVNLIGVPPTLHTHFEGWK